MIPFITSLGPLVFRRWKLFTIGALIVVITIAWWRIDYLHEKAQALARSLAGHMLVNEELIRNDGIRDRIATDAAAEAIVLERDLSRDMRRIEDEEDGPCAPVLCDTINRLLNDTGSTGSDP